MKKFFSFAIIFILCLAVLTAAEKGNKSKKNTETQPKNIPQYVGVQLVSGITTVTDPKTGTVYVVDFRDGAIQSVSVKDPKDKTKSVALNNFKHDFTDCPDIQLCYDNPFEKRSVCVCLPPAQLYRPGSPLKTVWKFVSQ